MQKYNSRIEALTRNQSMNNAQLRNINNQIKQRIEEANLNMIANLAKMGINEEVLQSQDQNQRLDHIILSIQTYLVEAVDIIERHDELDNLQNL